MTQLFAQPYDLSADGFYFETPEEYTRKADALRNDYGDPVEEFEIQFIDGEDIDGVLAAAIGLHQGNFVQFFKGVAEWEAPEKTIIILAVSEGGYSFDDESSPFDFEVDIYEVESLRELAEQFVDEGLFGDIPERLQSYIDYDAIARDLATDYSEAVVAGTRLVYRCG